jgi:SAM-dependent methyltransferase
VSLFRRDDKSNGPKMVDRPPRNSSGWRDILAYLKETESLRVLDFGATSSHNINYLTGMGHSVYMANVVQEAARPEWRKPLEEGGAPEFDVAGFVEANLNFSGRDFDVVLVWDTADYLPPELVPALFARLHEVLRPHGRLLAFFQGSAPSPQTPFARYQLTDSEQLLLLASGTFPFQRMYQTRQIEKFLVGYASVRFFLGKDNIREVIAIR